MAGKSAIEWTDATVNFWWGCTKVGPGCDHCYAETWAKRTGHSVWGLDMPRRQIKSAVALLDRLNRNSVKFADEHDGRARRVFIQSMSDLFDLEVYDEWFAGAWARIEEGDCLDIQIVTKRISAVEKRLAQVGCTKWPKHAGLMITVVNQAEADRDVPRLLALKTKLGIPWVGLSIEPLLGPINLRPWLSEDDGCESCDDGVMGSANRCSRTDIPRTEQCPRNFAVVNCVDLPPIGADGHPAWVQCDRITLDWIITGGESGPNARPMHPQWARDLRDQCDVAGVPFFFKQWGEWAPHKPVAGDDLGGDVRRGICRVVHPTGQSDVEVFEATGGRNTIPGTRYVKRLGKKAAGRSLGGKEHNGFPSPASVRASTDDASPVTDAGVVPA